jgi:plasmid stabilization system protein ParE
VATFSFSGRAATDLFEIGFYTLRTWGETQTIRYIGQLEDCCQLLANPLAVRMSQARFSTGRSSIFNSPMRLSSTDSISVINLVVFMVLLSRDSQPLEDRFFGVKFMRLSSGWD